MLDAENPPENPAAETPEEPGAPAAATADAPVTTAPAKRAATKKVAGKKTAAKKTTAKKTATTKKTATKSAPGLEKTATKKMAGATSSEPVESAPEAGAAAPPPATMLLFQPPDASKAPPRKQKSAATVPDEAVETQTGQEQGRPSVAQKPADSEAEGDTPPEAGDGPDLDGDDEGASRRRRRRGGRRRRKPDEKDDETSDSPDEVGSASESDNVSDSETDSEGSSGTRRRRRRRRPGDDPGTSKDDPDKTVTRVRKPRAAEDEITSLTGSTRLEAKKQRRREGREAGRRRAPIASEAEFLARREAVERVMVIRQKKDLTQIAVLEDKVLVEHYVARESQTSLIGNVYLGRVQNVLPSMEAAFIDIGKGRNAVLYAGEVNWDALGGKGGGQRKIEQVLKSGQPVLVQVSKDPSGHKGARLTSQISLPGRFLVYVPDGTTSGISRKLPDTERNRLKTLLKEIVPESAGVIVRTAAEGASEEELTRDVERLTARWEDIESKVEGGGAAPKLLYGEPDLTLKVVRDPFTEDFGKLVVSGSDAWEVVDEFVKHIAPDLEERLEKYDGDNDVFAAYRIDEQIVKGLDRKVWLPSGGSLVVDRTEAMTVVDVNTGKFTGSGGNLEETVTRNNLEAAEEIVRQLRLRDIGGIIVVDFIDMVLESNRDLVLRRMVECLGRDRTRHQVAEVTSLGLVQMTRKRIGTGLLEAFSETCGHCQGRGVLVHHEPIETRSQNDDEPRRNRRGGRNRGRDGEDSNSSASLTSTPSPKDVAAMAKPENADRPPLDQIDVPSAEAADMVAASGEVASRAKAPEVDQPDAVQVESPIPAAEPAQAQGPGPVRERKRSARREQGPATTTPETTAVVIPDAANGADQHQELSQAAPETSPNGASPPAAAPPRVVTSVRRRGAASRPAGPPAGSQPEERSTVDGVVSASVLGDEPAAGSQAHVPVKKKGSRKR